MVYLPLLQILTSRLEYCSSLKFGLQPVETAKKSGALQEVSVLQEAGVNSLFCLCFSVSNRWLVYVKADTHISYWVLVHVIFLHSPVFF